MLGNGFHPAGFQAQPDRLESSFLSLLFIHDAISASQQFFNRARFVWIVVCDTDAYRKIVRTITLCVRQRKFVVTTDSNHTRRIYPNLAPGMILTAHDQLWCLK